MATLFSMHADALTPFEKPSTWLGMLCTIVQVAGTSAKSGPLNFNAMIDNTLGGIAGSDGLLGGATGLLTNLLTGMRQGRASAQAQRSRMGKAPLGRDKVSTGQTVECSRKDNVNYDALPQRIDGRKADMAGVLYCRFRVNLAAPITDGSVTAVATVEIPDVGNSTAVSAPWPIDFDTSSQIRSRGDEASVTDIVRDPQTTTQQHLHNEQAAVSTSSEDEARSSSTIVPASTDPSAGAVPLPAGFTSPDAVITSQTKTFQFQRELRFYVTLQDNTANILCEQHQLCEIIVDRVQV